LKQGETVVWPQSMELEDYETEVEELQPFKRAPITQQPSRGIVTTGGNADTTARLITLLRFLRNEYHVTLPVEVWAFPGELKQGSDQWRDIEALNGQIREVPESYHLVKDTGAWKNFQIKGLAIALSSFQELIYLDSDNIPLRDPTCLFETESYTKEDSGKAVFWPDLSKDHVDNAIWRVMGTPCTLDDFTFESGQIVIDKVGSALNHWRRWLLTLVMNFAKGRKRWSQHGCAANRCLHASRERFLVQDVWRRSFLFSFSWFCL
jgi:hypothetical protein